MRIGILTQWYEPEAGPAALPTVLARGLAERGHEVQVITGFPNYPTGELSPGYRITRRMDERIDQVAVRRVALYPSHDGSPARRLANYSSFGISAVVSGLDALKNLDAIWVNYSPITVAWPMWAARYGYQIPCVVHILDLWPDTVLASGFVRVGRAYNIAEKALHAWCNAMYRSAKSVAYISPGVGEVLRRRGVDDEKLMYLPMWANENVFKPSSDDLRAELGLGEDAIVLVYAGALGPAQGLSTLIEACSRVQDSRFRCLIAGSGSSDASLRQLADDLGVTNIMFLGRVPQSSMTAVMATGDFSYVGLRTHPSSRLTMPSKAQASLAAGRALLVAAEGDVASMVRESGTGFEVHPGDPAAIAKAIEGACKLGRSGLQEMGNHARTYYEDTFSATRGIEQIEALLGRAASGQGAR